jgi:hypothetical protein
MRGTPAEAAYGCHGDHQRCREADHQRVAGFTPNNRLVIRRVAAKVAGTPIAIPARTAEKAGDPGNEPRDRQRLSAWFLRGAFTAHLWVREQGKLSTSPNHPRAVRVQFHAGSRWNTWNAEHPLACPVFPRRHLPLKRSHRAWT